MMSDKPKFKSFLPVKLPMLQVPENSYYPFNPSLDDELRRLFAEDFANQNNSVNHEIHECNACKNSDDPSWPTIIHCESCQRYRPVANPLEEFRQNGADIEYISESEEEKLNEPKQITSAQLSFLRSGTRQKKVKKSEPNVCVFCKNNGEHEVFFKSHVLKDCNGRVLCPILRQYVCPICGATAENAHTTGHCPLKSSTKMVETSDGTVRKIMNYNKTSLNINYDDLVLDPEYISKENSSISNYITTNPEISSSRESSSTLNHIVKPVSLNLFLKSINSNYDDRMLITHFSNMKRISTGKLLRE